MLGGVHSDGCDLSSRQATPRTVPVPDGPGHQERVVAEAREISLRTTGAIPADELSYNSAPNSLKVPFTSPALS